MNPIFQVLAQIQMQVSERLGGVKIDVYRQEGKGILCVRHGQDLTPENVVFAMSDFEF